MDGIRAVDRTSRVCVVGAGSSGLVAAKNLLECGFEVDVLERGDEPGGIWNYGSPNARVYRSTHTISSRSGTQYPDFLLPEHYPDYPHHTQMLAYLQAYAAHFGVDRRIEYRVAVERLEPVHGGAAWEVTLAGGETRRYAAVVIANGHLSSPRWPQYPGEFLGRVMHSADYRSPELFAGQRILVVGGGNSGCDIAVEAAQTGSTTFHSTRRGYFYLPKYLFGVPADQVGELMHRLRLPLGVRRVLSRLGILVALGPLRRSGLPLPDHRLFETHPTVNSLLPYYVKHGRIIPKPDIERLEARAVRFVDGSREEVDVIVYATGYRIDFPFIDRRLLEWRDGYPRLYKHVFHPHYDNLFVAGMIQPDSGQFGLVHWQTRAIALFLFAQHTGSAAAEWLRMQKRHPDEDLGAGIHYRASPRHFLEVERASYLRGLRRIVTGLERAGGFAHGAFAHGAFAHGAFARGAFSGWRLARTRSGHHDEAMPSGCPHPMACARTSSTRGNRASSGITESGATA